MDWTWLTIVSSDADAALAVMLAAALGFAWWQLRRWRTEREELRALKERPVYEHRFECKPMLNRMQREREILFIRHRAPVGSGEARARRVAAAREKLLEQDLLHEES
jgi:hypothetical protein